MIKPTVTIREVDKGLDELKKVLSDLKKGKSYVKVGVVGGSADTARADADGLTNAQLAAVHEYGAPERGIPERSFIRAPFAANRQQYIQQLRGLVAKVYRRQLSISRALGLMGAKISADLKNNITAGEGVPPPNAPATVKAKGSSRPLVDTGRLLGSISWDVVLNGSKED